MRVICRFFSEPNDRYRYVSLAVPDADISLFLFCLGFFCTNRQHRGAYPLYPPPLSLLHSSSALSRMPLSLSLSLDLSACHPICHEVAVGFLTTAAPPLICACPTLLPNNRLFVCNRFQGSPFSVDIYYRKQIMRYKCFTGKESDISYTRVGSKSALTITYQFVTLYIYSHLITKISNSNA